MRGLAFALLLAAPARAVNYTLTVSTSGPVSTSVVTSSNPATGINCGNGHHSCAASFSSGSTVTLTEVDDSTTVFAGWTGAQGCGTNQASCRFLMAQDSAVTATFIPTVSISLFGNGMGVVTDSSTLVNCSSFNGCIDAGAQLYSYPTGSTVVFEASAGSSSTFVAWSGDAGCNVASTCTITLNGYEAIVATFTSAGPFTIDVTVIGSGSVTSSPAGINCPSTCAAEFSAGTPVALTTAAASGSFFAGWSNGGCSGANPCTVTSSSTYQGLGGNQSPAAFFYKNR